MNEFEVSATRRAELGKGATRRLRAQGLVPGVLYGAGRDSETIAMNRNELRKQFEHEAFFSHILTVNVDGDSTQAVIKDLQRDPASAEVTHVDFQRIMASEELTMRVPLHFLNEETCPGRKQGGVIATLINDVEIVCLPRNLPEFIAVDLGMLELNESIHLSEIPLPEGVEYATAIEDAAHDHTVVTVEMAQDLDLGEEEEEVEAGEVEVIGEAAPAEPEEEEGKDED